MSGRVSELAPGDYRLGIMSSSDTSEVVLLNPEGLPDYCGAKSPLGYFDYILKADNTDLQSIDYTWTPSGDIFSNGRYSILGRTMFLAKASKDCKEGYIKSPVMMGVIGYANGSEALKFKEKPKTPGKLLY